LLDIVRYVDKIAHNSEMLSFIQEPSDLFLAETSFIYKPEDNNIVLVFRVLLVSPHNLMALN